MAMDDVEVIQELPRDLAIDCILRAPLSSHAALRQVCRSWRAIATDTAFYSRRRALGYTDHYACFTQAVRHPNTGKSPAHGISIYDPRKATWHALPPPPDFPTLPLFCHCVSAGSRLYLVGGWDPATWQVLGTVLVYDFTNRSWARGADIPIQASFFACAALPDGTLAIAGGHDADKNALRAAHLYKPDTDTWVALPDMNLARDECKGVLLNGKFTVISGFGTESQGLFCRSAEVYDPAIGKWELIDNFWPSAKAPSSAVIVKDDLYAVIEGKLMKWEKAAQWTPVAPAPAEMKVAASASAVEDGILISGYRAGGIGSHTCEASVWQFSLRRKEWRNVGIHPGFSGVAQAACSVQV